MRRPASNAWPRPVIRDRANGVAAISMAVGMPFRPLAGNLIVHYVLDEGSMNSPIFTKHLEELGVNEADLHDIAMANLRRLGLTLACLRPFDD